MRRIRSRRAACAQAFLVMPFLVCSLTGWAAPGPRAVSAAEAAGVEIVADFLARGPAAFRERLAPESWLSALDAAAALAEIEARTGPVDGATWTLETVVPSLADRLAVFEVEFPAGIDDVIEIELVERDGRHLVLALRSHAESGPDAFRLPWSGALQKDAGPPPLPLRRFVLPAMLILGFTLLVPGAMRLSLLAGRVSGAVATAACCVLMWLVARDVEGVVRASRAGSESVASGTERLGMLRDLRRALALGERRVVDEQTARHGVVAIWEAQVLLHGGDLENAWTIVEHFPLDSDRPMVHLLRARIAAGARDPVASSRAYERAIRLGPGRDGLWIEAAERLKAGGFEDRAVTRIERLPDIGSRDPRVYYALSTLAMSKRKSTEAARWMSTAWSQEPLRRAEVLSRPALAAMLGIEEVAALVSLSSPREPKFRTDGSPSSLVMLPPECQATVTGNLLTVTAGDAKLIVPGGATLVSEDAAEVLDAQERQNLERARWLSELESLVEGAAPAALVQPSLRERVQRTAEALADHGRWADLERLTAQLQPTDEAVPFDLLLHRGVALFRLGRTEDAQRLAVGVAGGPAVRRGVGPEEAYQLGELLAALDLHAPAIRMLERADAMLEDVSLDDRIRQLSMNRRLAEAYKVHASANFELRYPPDVSVFEARSLAEVMESELTRLRKIIPVESFRRTTVNIVWWSEFRSIYTFSDHILGFYDGRITLPFAGVPTREPAMVAIVTHELAHALIAQASADRAPGWLHEGLAQRVEMGSRHPSAFGMYPEDRLLPVALVDPVLRGSVDPGRIAQAYITSQTFIRFLEARWGLSGIATLLRSLRDEGDPDAALRAVTGMDGPALEEAFREWGRKQLAGFESAEMRRYDRDESGLTGGRVRRSRGGGE